MIVNLRKNCRVKWGLVLTQLAVTILTSIWAYPLQAMVPMKTEGIFSSSLFLTTCMGEEVQGYVELYIFIYFRFGAQMYEEAKDDRDQHNLDGIF